MRKYGTSLLQSFAEGPSLIAPEQIGALRALAEHPNEGMIAGAVRAITSGLGVSQRTARDEMSVSVDAMCAAMGATITDRNKPFAFSDGIAIIPMWGALLHRDGYCDSYATGYDFIRAKFDAAMVDPDVKGIVFDINSPGGHVAGNFELADEIFAGRSVKPSISIIDSMCYSGGYSLGSATGRMVATPSGGVGSIGVVMMHVSVEALMEKWGVDINFIHAGAHKVDGNMFQALPDDVRARYQASVGRSYEKFVSLVARNRGMDAEKVRSTEALCFDVDEGLSLGLIDAIQTPKDALAAFRKELSGSSTFPQQGAKKMSNDTAQPDVGGESTATAPTTAATPPAAAPAAAATADPQKAVADDRQRVNAILSCEEAQGREDLAKHFALSTDTSVDDAKKALGLAPKSAAASATGAAFVAAMDNGDNPNVGADGGKTNGEMSVGQRIAANFHGSTGNAFKRNE
jgi:signal peptide peptidase SppA